MINFLPKWYLHDNKPTFYDRDSVTMLELAAKLHGAMNELIADYNQFVEDTNSKLETFINATEQDQEVFRTALRQEFQDFIDIIDLKIKTIQDEIDSINKEITGIQIEYDELTESLIIGGAEQ